jgi:3-oxoacyl-[acyl-carrier protein] reductase
MDLGLQDKVAIVTGAGGGIGSATAARLAMEGCRVVIADIDLRTAVEQASVIGERALAVGCDVTDGDSVAAMVDVAVDAFGTVDILVNNAGFQRDMRITKMDEANWDAVVDVVLKGAFLCTRAVLPHMTGRRWGRLIHVSSRAHLGNPGQANYSAAKAGLLGFSRAMALENGRFGVTSNAVAPGLIDTDAVRALAHYEKVRDNAERTLPIPRIGEVSDVADTIAFLASELAGYISGETVHVTGGRY